MTETATRRRTAAYDAGDLRRDLLDAAIAVETTEGPAAVNLRALARQLGVSHAAPANHFADKTATFTATAQEGFELMGRAMAQAVAEVGDDQPAPTRSAATGRAYLQFALSHPAHFEVMWQGTVAYLAWASVHGLAVLWLSRPLSNLDDRPFEAVASAVGALLTGSLATYVPPRSEGDPHA